MRRLLLVLVSLFFLPGSHADSGAERSSWNSAGPLVNRIRGATIVVPDAPRVAEWYRRWFDYVVIENGKLPAELARSWGAEKMAGRPYMVLTSRGTPDVFLRIVHASAKAPLPERRPSFGWGSMEFVVADLNGLRERLREGGIDVFREPGSLGPPFEAIFAMQVVGPAAQTLNLTLDVGDPAKSNLPQARSPVDRLFLVGLNGPDLAALRAFYTEKLGMRGFPNYDQPIPSLAKELGLPATQVFPMALVRAAQKGNTVELHGLPPPAGPRAALPGELPAGVAIVSLEVCDVEGMDMPWITPPTRRKGRVYGGMSAATMIGPAGERIEMIGRPAP